MYNVTYLRTGKSEVMDRNEVLKTFPMISAHFLTTGMCTNICIRSKEFGKILIKEIGGIFNG